MRHGKTAVSSHHSNMDVGFSGFICVEVFGDTRE
jgi:hypothetical protein